MEAVKLERINCLYEKTQIMIYYIRKKYSYASTAQSGKDRSLSSSSHKYSKQERQNNFTLFKKKL